MINMNLPAINNKMKNHNNQFRPDPSSMADGFGLGIQVFKIESVKNIDNGFKSKNRNAIKNIENPTQTNSFKPPLMPKPKRLPSLQKSSSEINHKQRISALVSTKMQLMTQNGLTDKIYERKQAESNTIVTPVSYSVRKKPQMSTQKNIITNQTTKPLNQKNFIIQKQKPGRALGNRLNQTAPPQTMYKPQESYYVNYHAQHEVLLRFYTEFEASQKQHLKQIKQLKKMKQNQIDYDTYERIEYLQSLEGKVNTVIESIEKQEFDQKIKELTKGDDKKSKRVFNTILPISGFQFSEIDLFVYDSIQNYESKNYAGSFKFNSYQNVDLAPVLHQPKPQSDDQQ